MFCTHPDGEMTIPEIFDEGEEYWWSYIKLPLFVPYFQVVCGSSLEPSTGCAQTFFFPTIDQVMMILADVTVDVNSVQLVSPGYMNGSGDWQIDKLQSVLRGVEVQSGEETQYAYIYVVASGSRYLQSGIAANESELANLEVVCDLSFTSE